MTTQLDVRIINSARWAAYGDALGFISELTDAKGLLRRLRYEVRLTGDEGPIPWAGLPIDSWPLQRTVDWQRRIGGRQGALASLPAGTYSDDTQLRLATCRAIGGANQSFDLEVFTKVELPVWQSYALGAGRASKRAAANLARGGQWLANSYSGWTEAGGNGVVIRVQPHAWEGAKRGRSSYEVMMDVLKNGLSTHGHPRALASACVHADILLQVLRKDRNSVSLREIQYAVDHASRIPELLGKDPELSRFTIPAWELTASKNFSDSWHRVIKEMSECVDQLAEALEGSAGLTDEQKVDRYFKLLKLWGLFNDEQRGSGTGTIFAALALLFLFPEDLDKGIRVACGTVNSDTDSIATVYGAMAGALLPTPSELPGPIQDDRYIVQEALRLGSADRKERFPYPDLLYWHPPQAQADAALLVQGRKFVTGLGFVKSDGPIFEAAGGFNWQWLLLEFGQNILIKQRNTPKDVAPDLAESLLPATNPSSRFRNSRIAAEELRGDEGITERLRRAASRNYKADYRQETLIDIPRSPSVEGSESSPRLAPLESAIQEAHASGMSSETIGRLLMELSREVSIDVAVAFAGVIGREVRNARPNQRGR